MSIQLIRSGILDTIQDQGRHGYSKWGINPSGTMDCYAAQAANILVGNALDEAVIEMHFPSGEFLFGTDALVSITGADFTPMINSKAVPLWKPLLVKKHSVLSFKRRQWGYRCYLAVGGGFEIAPWLGSRSTNMRISAGGLQGRALKKADQVNFRRQLSGAEVFDDVRILPWRVNAQPVYHDAGSIFFVEGREWAWLTSASQQQVLSDPFSIAPSSDRMGCYLQHEPLAVQRTEELLSSGVSMGTIQLLPSGKLVVLMADHQTTGGYPRIGHIVSAHLPKLSQLAPHESLRLRMISVADAEKMLFSLQQELRALQRACLEKLSGYDL